MTSKMTSTPIAGQSTRKTSRGRPRKNLTMSPIESQNPPDSTKPADTNKSEAKKAADGDKQKTYSKRQRKPVKRYEFEDYDDDEMEVIDNRKVKVEEGEETAQTDLSKSEDNVSGNVPTTPCSGNVPKTPGSGSVPKTPVSGKRRGRKPKVKVEKPDTDDTATETNSKNDAGFTGTQCAEGLNDAEEGNKTSSATPDKPVKGKRGRKPLKGRTESSETDTSSKNDVAFQLTQIDTGLNETGDVNKTSSVKHDKTSSEPLEKTLETPDTTVKRKRGRPKKSESEKKKSLAASANKLKAAAESDLKEDSINEEEDTNMDTSLRSSRKRKKLNYSMLNDGSQDEDQDEPDQKKRTSSGRGRKKKVEEKTQDEDYEATSDGDDTPVTEGSAKSKKKSAKKIQEGEDLSELKKKRAAERAKKYRENKKNDPIFKRNEIERKRLQRLRKKDTILSEEVRNREKVLSRIRQARYRENRKRKLEEQPDNKQPEQPPKKALTYTEHQRKKTYWKEKKRLQRENLTAQMKRRIREQDRLRYAQRKLSKTNYSAALPSTSQQSSYVLSASEKKQQGYRVKMEMPKSPDRFTQITLFDCPKCDQKYNKRPAMQRHVAIEHQMWWTPEEPQGDTEKRSLRKVIKIKKFLICPKCDKRINFIDYYFHHVEWCGREDERYTCEHCGHKNLKAIWKGQHLMYCSALVRQAQEEREKEREMERKEEGQDSKQDEGEGTLKKRRAATKAMSIVQNLSKKMADDDDDNDIKDNKEKDPDADIDEEEEEEEDHVDEDLDEDLDEEEESFYSDVDEDYVENGGRSNYTNRIRNGGRFEAGANRDFTKYLTTFPLMLKYMKRHCSGHVLFPDWLPQKTQWVGLEDKEAASYLPETKKSRQFMTSNTDTLFSLDLYQSEKIDDFSVIYTGLSVWKVAWCPVPLNCEDNQYLAVIGKREPSGHYFSSHHRGPGTIQIWNVGSLKLTKCEVTALPRLWYNVVHDYGMATAVQWCPSGCYSSKEEQPESDNHQRLGLLAVSFTDGSVRIFSLPHLPPPKEGEIRTYKPDPVANLFPSRFVDKINMGCSCIDWHQVKSHKKILAGYSNGSVRLFNLETQTPHLQFKSNKDSVACILPFQSFHAHGRLVRSVRWIGKHDDIIVTACESFDTFVWHLSNVDFPLFVDPPVFMVTCMASSLFHAGTFTGSDDNYAIGSNRGRYFEVGSISYNYQTDVRKDEFMYFNFSTQSACIWDVSYSNWLCYVICCDNRGNLHGMPMTDTIRYLSDQKIYKYRQLLLTTEEKLLSNKSDNEENSKDCDCGETECVKCDKTQDNVCDNWSTNSQSTTDMQHSDQSKQVLENSEMVPINSAQSEQVLKHSETVPVNSSQSKEVIENSESVTEHSEQVIHSDSDSKVFTEDENKPDTARNPNDIYLKFNEHFKTVKSGLFDTDPDDQAKSTGKPLKTVSFNPNHLQCTWVAYGGDAGLIRVINIHKLLPGNCTKRLKVPNSVETDEIDPEGGDMSHLTETKNSVAEGTRNVAGAISNGNESLNNGKDQIDETEHQNNISEKARIGRKSQKEKPITGKEREDDIEQKGDEFKGKEGNNECKENNGQKDKSNETGEMKLTEEEHS